MPKPVAALPLKLSRKDHKSDDKGTGRKPQPRQQAEGGKAAHKEPPNSSEAEKGVLSSCLQDQNVVAEVARYVTPAHMHNVVHSDMWKAVLDMSRAGMSIDLLTFTQFLSDRGLLAKVGGPGYVTEVQGFVPTSANVSAYVEILRQKFILRQMISTGVMLQRSAYGASDEDTQGLIERAIDAVERIRHASQGPNGSEKFDFADLMSFDSMHDPKCLVGNRYIVRGGSSLWAGGSGYGKSSLQLQLAVYWGCGIPCFGLRPVRPIKSLIIQAENDRGDMSEQLQGVIAGVNAVGDIDIQEKRTLIEKNIGIHRVVGKAGLEFLNLLDTLAEIDRPDMVWIDPLFAFSGCDLLNPEKTGRFLREGLFAVADKRNVALNVIHHVGKPVRDAKPGAQQMSEIDYQYLGFGTSEIQNAFRAVNVLVPVASSGGTFKLVLSKRGERAGAKNTAGEWSRSIYLKHSREGICWIQVEEPDEDEKSGRPSKFDPKVILDELSLVHGVKTDALRQRLYREHNMSRATFFRIFGELKKEGKVLEDAEGWKRKPKRELK